MHFTGRTWRAGFRFCKQQGNPFGILCNLRKFFFILRQIDFMIYDFPFPSNSSVDMLKYSERITTS